MPPETMFHILAGLGGLVVLLLFAFGLVFLWSAASARQRERLMSENIAAKDKALQEGRLGLAEMQAANDKGTIDVLEKVFAAQRDHEARREKTFMGFLHDEAERVERIAMASFGMRCDREQAERALQDVVSHFSGERRAEVTKVAMENATLRARIDAGKEIDAERLIRYEGVGARADAQAEARLRREFEDKIRKDGRDPTILDRPQGFASIADIIMSVQPMAGGPGKVHFLDVLKRRSFAPNADHPDGVPADLISSMWAPPSRQSPKGVVFNGGGTCRSMPVSNTGMAIGECVRLPKGHRAILSHARFKKASDDGIVVDYGYEIAGDFYSVVKTYKEEVSSSNLMRVGPFDEDVWVSAHAKTDGVLATVDDAEFKMEILPKDETV